MMRSVVTALVIVALLAIWLIIQYPDDTGPNEALIGSEATPVTIPNEPDLPVADQEEFQVTIPDKRDEIYIVQAGTSTFVL